MVHEAAIAEVPLAPGSFDVVTLWDVVEHLLDPVGDVRRLALALKPGGVFALSTHDISCLAARVLGPRYPFLMPMHVTHFTPRTIGRLFAAAGLHLTRVEPHIRWLRVAYLVKKLASAQPRLAAAAGAVVRGARLSDRYVPVVGLGLFNAYAVKD